MTNAVPIVAAVLGAVAGPYLAVFASRRSAAQPVALDMAAERGIIEQVEADPSLLRWAADLDGSCFADGALGRRWDALAASPSPSPTGAGAAELGDVYATAVAAALGDAPAGPSRQVADWAETIRACAEDRALDGGHDLIAVDDPDTPLRRELRPASTVRRAACAVIAAAAGAAAVWLTSNPLAALTVAVLAAGLIVLSLVDLDTLYIDGPVFWALTATTWVLAAADAVVAGEPGRLLAGLGITALLAAGIAGVAWAYTKIRKRGGLGGGDLLLLLVVVAVPATISGDWTVPIAGLMVAMGLAILVRLALIAARRSRSSDPFAFGPYLSVGWLVAWAAVTVGGTL
jgi:leader peptidase (prepilin peptidase)/N-methyltransferase